jgi:hypothetical protein
MNDWFYVAKGAKVGPVTQADMGSLLQDGTISANTLVWNTALGQAWKPLRDTEIGRIESDQAPPLPASCINNTYAWLLASVPVIGSLIEKQIYGVVTFSGAVLLAYIVVNSILSGMDARKIEASGRNTKHINMSLALFLGSFLVPAYLLLRARALGQFPKHLCIWGLAMVAGFCIDNPEFPSQLVTGKIYWGSGLPTCESSFTARQVKDIFKDLPLMRAAYVAADDVSDQKEVSSDKKLRTCTATVTATNGSKYPVKYRIEDRGNDQFYTYVELNYGG